VERKFWKIICPKKRHPRHELKSVLQVALLEEELAGRRSFWRRQRHREDELTEVESKLHRQLMEDEHVTAYHVQEQLESIQEGVFNARMTEKRRHTQRKKQK